MKPRRVRGWRGCSREHPEVQRGRGGGGRLEALERIEQLRPDLVFLDIQMPGLDGFQVLRPIPRACRGRWSSL